MIMVGIICSVLLVIVLIAVGLMFVCGRCYRTGYQDGQKNYLSR
jgi:hypothetical protein